MLEEDISQAQATDPRLSPAYTHPLFACCTQVEHVPIHPGGGGGGAGNWRAQAGSQAWMRRASLFVMQRAETLLANKRAQHRAAFVQEPRGPQHIRSDIPTMCDSWILH